MKRLKQFQLALLITVIIASLVSCAGFNKSSYRAMGTMATAYDVAMKSAADLHSRGLISDAGKQAIITEARNYSIAHNKAIDAFQAYLAAESPDEQERLKQQYVAAARVMLNYYSALLNIFNRYGVLGGEQVQPWF